VPIHVPPLRERPEDIPLLATYFHERFWSAHRGASLPIPKLTKGALWALRSYSWPGNVRELQNVMEHAAVLLEPGAEVRPEDIPFIGETGGEPDADGAADNALEGDGYYAARERLLAKFDRRFLTKVVLRAGGNLSKAARIAHVDRTTFYRLMERYGLQRDSLAGTPPEA
jgi:DNA-binding NtrC family response regulator